MKFISKCPLYTTPSQGAALCMPLKQIAYGSVSVPVIRSSHVACRNEGHRANVKLVQYFLMKSDSPFVQLCLIRHEYS